jgi:type IV pilus assembly protein PilY1
MEYNALRILKNTVTKATALGVVVLALHGHAVELNDYPVTSSSATSVRPNLLFVLDDSGSMASDFMPDDIVGNPICRDSTGTNKVGCQLMDPPFMSPDVNGIYYNPSFAYLPPVNADGTSRPEQYRAAGAPNYWDQVQTDPYLNPNSKKDLVNTYTDRIWCKANNPTVAQYDDVLTKDPASTVCRRNGYAYTAAPVASVGYNYPDGTYKYNPKDGSGNQIYATDAPYYYQFPNVKWCKDASLLICQARKDPVFKYANYGAPTRTDILSAKCTPTCPGGRSYSAEMTNFSNWYAYYRTRMSMMKTGVGRAFSGLDGNYRAGFMTIHTAAGDSSKFVPIKTFDQTQKNAWFAKLYGISPNSGTPLREALSTAGGIYAGKILNNVGGNSDPVQYSCQKNYTILSTDGLWNGSDGFKVDGSSAVGNQDNTVARPKYDGNLLSGTSTGASFGGSDTLADVAMYYYKTDLRNSTLSNCAGVLGTDVCKDNVAPSRKDPASHQHMTTFTIGLGVDGLYEYRPDYETAGIGTYANILAGSLNWPSPKENDITTIDDLWHAAVNGGGTYYSARNPQALSDGLGDALREVGARNGAAAAASTSNPQVTTSDNFVFNSQYRTAFWDSILKRQRINTSTGQLNGIVDWEAGDLLNAKVQAASDARKILIYKNQGASKLVDFVWSNLTSAQQAWFNPTLLPQWATLSDSIGKPAATGENLVNYLRGQKGQQDDSGSPDKPFRGRENTLGDIVNSETVYVEDSPFQYDDAGHADFRNSAAIKTRVPALYVAANDGMLHAFNGNTGDELWAFVPTPVLPNLYKLANKNYVHQFFNDGTPVVGDVNKGGWKTILVNGLNKGGKGFYALDITDPLNPKFLWEVCSSGCTQNIGNLGFSYGNPVITKLANGDWVVLITSGYNSADGKGSLYGLDPITGATKFTISTYRTGVAATECVPSATVDCGLAKISPWIRSYKDNTTLRAYGGDLAGNLWRFDINDTIDPSGVEAFKLAQLGNSTGLVQSITTRPELAMVDNKPVVYIGTGRMLSDSDKSDSSVQSFYGIYDDLGQTPLGVVRARGDMLKQTLTDSTSVDGRKVRTNSNLLMDWATKKGWYIDFPDAGERDFTDPSLVLGTLSFTTNVPTFADACSGGGYSYSYQVDFRSGGAVKTAPKATNGQQISAEFLGNEFATRPVVVQLPKGKLVQLIQRGDGTIADIDQNTKAPFYGRRATWRELIE